jgi:hypothetical protein
MINSLNGQSININSTDDFILQDIITHTNLKSLTLSGIEIDNWLIIGELFDNLNITDIDILDCEFTISGTNVQIKRVADDIEMWIKLGYTWGEIKPFMTNLPNCINSIYIDYSINGPDTLAECFTNLPFGLKKIEIKYANAANGLLHDDDLIKSVEREGKFNCLFGAKLPFGCQMIINISSNGQEKKYNVIYENNEEDELTLICENSNGENITVKKIIITNYTTYIYNTNYNVLRIMSGMGGLSYSS